VRAPVVATWANPRLRLRLRSRLRPRSRMGLLPRALLLLLLELELLRPSLLLSKLRLRLRSRLCLWAGEQVVGAPDCMRRAGPLAPMSMLPGRALGDVRPGRSCSGLPRPPFRLRARGLDARLRVLEGPGIAWTSSAGISPGSKLDSRLMAKNNFGGLGVELHRGGWRRRPDQRPAQR